MPVNKQGKSLSVCVCVLAQTSHVIIIWGDGGEGFIIACIKYWKVTIICWALTYYEVVNYDSELLQSVMI